MRRTNSLPAGVLAVAMAACAGAAEPEVTPAGVSRGDRIAATCVTCHHPANAHIPPLAGASAITIAAQANADDTIMQRLLAGLTEEDIRAVAASLARSHGGAP